MGKISVVGSFCAQACSRGGVWGSFAVVFVKKETGAAFGWREIAEGLENPSVKRA